MWLWILFISEKQCVWDNSFEFYEMKTPDKMIFDNIPNDND